LLVSDLLPSAFAKWETETMTDIHPTAYLDPQAQIGRSVRIGPNCFIGPFVRLGDGCRVHNNVTITGHTTVGQGCEFFPGCVIGAEPQDLKYHGEPSELIIGDDNVFRELTTAHPGTEAGGGVTQIGSHNRFLVGVHIAHDVVIEDNCVLANNVQLGGHVWVESFATFGGVAGIHHFVTIGRYAFVAALARVAMDVPPFMIMQGYESRVRGVNVTALARWGFSPERIQALKRAYLDLYTDRTRFAGPVLHRLTAMESDGQLTEDVQHLISSVRRTAVEGHLGRYLESKRPEATRRKARFYDEQLFGDKHRG
jgi:UDP-N-acetylglucosamine acyltransferase